MRWLLGILTLAIIAGGCSESAPSEPASPPKVQPGAIGITAGQSGTGTTSGASTGN